MWVGEMGKILVREEYLTSLQEDLLSIIEQLKELDQRLQRELHNIPWESKSRGHIIETYAFYQKRLQETNGKIESLANFVDTTKQDFIKKDKEGSFLGITGFNWNAPFDGAGNTVGTVTGAGAVGKVAYKVKNGYEVKHDFDRKNKRILIRESYDSVKDNKKINGRHREHKIYYINDVEKKIENGTASTKIKEIEAMIKKGSAAKMALKDKLGWASVAIDAYTDTSENIKSNASSDKIAGDIIGNVVVGGATTVGAAVLTVAALPAAAPALVVAAAGFGISVGLTYFTEGVKWDVDLDGDGEDDNVKDMVKTGAKKAWSTVAGWFN